MSIVILPTGPPAATAVVPGQTVASDLWDNGPAALDWWMRNPPHAVLAQTVAQSIVSGVGTSVSFDTAIRDNFFGGYVPAGQVGGGYTAQVPGTYLVQGVTNLAWGGAAGKTAGAYLSVSASSIAAAVEIPAAPAVSRIQHSISALIRMRVNDFVQLQIFQNSGAAQPTGFTATGCRMSVRWIAL